MLLRILRFKSQIVALTSIESRTPQEQSVVARTGIRGRKPDTFAFALGLVLIVTSVLRIVVGANRPLWLDEVQTAIVVSQPTLKDFVQQYAHDVTSPLYYLIGAGWAKVSGVSNFSLRALPLAFGIVSPVVALFAQGINKPTRYTWCALLACWIPGIWYSHEARPYTMVFSLAVANAIAFAAALRTPGIRAAWIWAGISSLLVLAHYYGAVLVAAQAVAYIAVHRRRALENWPIVLAGFPIIIAVFPQWHSLHSFVSPKTAWINIATPGSIGFYIGYIFGQPLIVVYTLIWFAIFSLLWLRLKGVGSPSPLHRDSELATVGACSAIAAIASIGLAFLAPVLIGRYLTVFVPGIFLSLALLATRLTQTSRLAAVALISVYLAAAITWGAQPHRQANRLNWEAASEALMAGNPKRLVFMWDTPMGGSPDDIAAIGGFFFERAGRPIAVDPVIVAGGTDPNRLLLHHAAAPGSAILWVYDLAIRGTAAVRFPPSIHKLDPAWWCRDFGTGRFGIIACQKSQWSTMREAALK